VGKYKKYIYFVFSPFCVKHNFFSRRTTILALKQKRSPHNLKNDKIQIYACKLHIDYGAHKRLQKINAKSHFNFKICFFFPSQTMILRYRPSISWQLQHYAFLLFYLISTASISFVRVQKPYYNEKVQNNLQRI
jgi:hypothetical protein